MSYVAFASSNSTDDGVPIAGVMIKGNDVIPTSSIKASVESSGFRDGSYIEGNTLVTSQRQLPLSDAIENAKENIKKTTIPGTSVAPINAADVQVDPSTGNVVVNVVEDFSTVQIQVDNSSLANNTTSNGTVDTYSSSNSELGGSSGTTSSNTTG